jgi:hypothetical protein
MLMFGQQRGSHHSVRVRALKTGFPPVKEKAWKMGHIIVRESFATNFAFAKRTNGQSIPFWLIEMTMMKKNVYDICI